MLDAPRTTIAPSPCSWICATSPRGPAASRRPRRVSEGSASTTATSPACSSGSMKRGSGSEAKPRAPLGLAVHVIEPDPLLEALVRRQDVHEIAPRDREELEVDLRPHGLGVRLLSDRGDPPETLADVDLARGGVPSGRLGEALCDQVGPLSGLPLADDRLTLAAKLDRHALGDPGEGRGAEPVQLLHSGQDLADTDHQFGPHV